MAEIGAEPQSRNDLIGFMLVKQLNFNRSILGCVGRLVEGKEVLQHDLLTLHDRLDDMTSDFAKLLGFLVADEKEALGDAAPTQPTADSG